MTSSGKARKEYENEYTILPQIMPVFLWSYRGEKLADDVTSIPFQEKNSWALEWKKQLKLSYSWL